VSPIPGAPKTLGSRNDTEELAVAMGERSSDDGPSVRVDVSGELDHPGLMLEGASGSIAEHRTRLRQNLMQGEIISESVSCIEITRAVTHRRGFGDLPCGGHVGQTHADVSVPSQ
jgi:hypothetical protein